MQRRSRNAARLTEVLLLIGRARPLADALVSTFTAEVGLTIAGWQIASALGREQLTVPELAARVGRRRQSVQVAVDELLATRHATRIPNPRRSRSPFIALTTKGVDAFWIVADRHARWMNEHASRFSCTDLERAVVVLREFENMLTAEADR
jgi:DNA-binding MarR family transcriptional regulator